MRRPSKGLGAGFDGLELVLKGYLLDQGLEEIWQLALIHKYWLLVVDHNFALKTRPYSLRKGVLTILVPDGAYAQILRLKFKRVLIEQLGQLDEPIQLRDVDFKIGEVERLLGSSVERQAAQKEELERLRQGGGLRLTPERIAQLFASGPEDFVEEIRADGQVVKRHKADLKAKPRRFVPLDEASKKAGEASAQGIHDERLRRLFAKARARALQKQKKS
ncbi:MAG: DciA family protein [bacterium]|nr:DciA family protein [bacterium]